MEQLLASDYHKTASDYHRTASDYHRTPPPPPLPAPGPCAWLASCLHSTAASCAPLKDFLLFFNFSFELADLHRRPDSVL